MNSKASRRQEAVLGADDYNGTFGALQAKCFGGGRARQAAADEQEIHRPRGEPVHHTFIPRWTGRCAD